MKRFFSLCGALLLLCTTTQAASHFPDGTPIDPWFSNADRSTSHRWADNSS